MLLQVLNLKVSMNGKKIINHLNLNIKKGEVHAIMGPNGTGKSTLSHVIAGKNGYDVIGGKILFSSYNIERLSCDARARLGIFMSYQYPIEIPGVNWNIFLKASIDSIRKNKGLTKISGVEFIKIVKKNVKLLNIDLSLLKRDVNYGFSGGEKKKFEILQMLLLNPTFVILDEIDSGLDIDALRIISKAINYYKNSDNGLVVITHYNRILDYINPDFVHIFSNGSIIKSGNKYLALEIESKGYKSFK